MRGEWNFLIWVNLMKFWFSSSTEFSVSACSRKHKRQQKEQLESGNKMLIFLQLLAGIVLFPCWNRHSSASVGVVSRDTVTHVSSMLLLFFFIILFFDGSIGQKIWSYFMPTFSFRCILVPRANTHYLRRVIQECIFTDCVWKQQLIISNKLCLMLCEFRSFFNIQEFHHKWNIPDSK